MSINSSSGGSSSLRNLNLVSDKLVKSMDRLSSGLRIRTASDDAAGMAIASALEAEATVGRKGIDNAGYAQSALSIADAAVGQVQNIANRLNELAQQSANGVLSDEQRSSLQTEFSQLTQEIDRISQTTQFNGVSLLQGEGFKVPVGDASDPANSIEMTGMQVNASALAGHDISTQDAAKAAMTAVNDLRRTLSEAVSSIGAVEKRLDTASSTEKVAVENRLAAESRIRDVDYAAEVAEKTRLSILQNAGVALQAHSRQQEETVLSLLK